MPFSHLNPEGRARMVDVSDKPVTSRAAVARGVVSMAADTLRAIQENQVAKGDVLAVAQVAGVMAAKNCGQWIPLCHPLPIAGVDLHFRASPLLCQIEIEARVCVNGPTGVEMEAMTAVSAAALTIYDMAKALDKTMAIGPIYLVHKEGGKSGLFRHFRAQVNAIGTPDSGVSWLELVRGEQLVLLPTGGEAYPDLQAAWLNQAELNGVAPGTCLESGTLRLEVTFARGSGWLAMVNDGGVLRPGDWLAAAR